MAFASVDATTRSLEQTAVALDHAGIMRGRRDRQSEREGPHLLSRAAEAGQTQQTRLSHEAQK
eukprot:3991137-Pyramimonas_sp.AAC.1